MIEQIERDVIRTHPDMQFFSGDKEEAVRHRKVDPSLAVPIPRLPSRAPLMLSLSLPCLSEGPQRRSLDKLCPA